MKKKSLRFYMGLLNCFLLRNSSLISGVLVVFLIFSQSTWASETNGKKMNRSFRLHLVNEPQSLDPNLLRSGASNYLLGNLYRNLYKYDEQNQLRLDLAKSCQVSKNKMTCELKPGLKWSDGSPLTSQDFLRTYEKILDPKSGALRADLLFPLKNAQEIYTGKKSLKDLGVKTPSATTLIFEFSTPQNDYHHKLTQLALAPTKKGLEATSGPYKLTEWIKGKKIILKSNEYYHQKNAQRPPVEFLFIEEDGVALNLYEKGQLDFLRRLPTLYIDKYKNRPDFQWIPLLRLDYIGLSGQLTDQEDLRKAIIGALDYNELQKIFSAPTRPGCFGLPKDWFDQELPCYNFNPNLKKQQNTKKLRFMFSASGGDDHRRATEWMQNQWLKHANIRVQLEAKENKTFLEILRKNPPDIFRKGQPLDEPNCLNALQNFESNSPENLLSLKDANIDQWIQELRTTTNETLKKRLCRQAFLSLHEKHRLIPLGEVQFASLVKKDVKGIKVNSLNQLDLSDLSFTP